MIKWALPGSRWRMRLFRTAVVTTSLLVNVPVVVVPVWAEPTGGSDPAASSAKPVPSRPLPKALDPQIPAETRLPAASWPAPGVAVVDLPAAAAPSAAFTRGRVPRGTAAPGKESGRVRAGTLPVFIGRPAARAKLRSAEEDAGAGVPAKVRVEVLPHRKSLDLNVSGVLFRVDRADGKAGAGAAEVVFDYSSFRAAYGAGYGRRLRIVQYPACLLTTPHVPACARGTALATRNDTANKQLVAELAVEPPASDRQLTASTGSVFAVTGGASSGGGNYAAQPLSSAAEWSTSGGAGDFTWSYPLRLPPSPTGFAPQVGLSYSSGAADGQTAATNNQASWAGLGFELGSGYIERKYVPCAYQGHNTGDLCWKYDNAYLVLNGVATPLLPTPGGEPGGVSDWYAKKDNGWRIRRVKGGATLPGHDNDEERWVVTTQDGTQYWFGVSRQPTTNRETKSVWTVPVYAQNSGHPCWTGTFATSFCDQAWRWNLDYVTDRNGNSITYFYDSEYNYYGRGLDVYDQAAYVRGGTLTGIEYGSRANAEDTTPAARIVFSSVGRCAGGANECGPANEQNKANYPDVPTDQLCTNVAPCHNHSPSFFSIKRLSKATTYVHNPADPDRWQGVDSYDFDTNFYGSADDPVDPAMVLTNITRFGAVTATPIELEPGTWFNYVAMQNRVDVDTANGSPPLVRHRLEHIYDEFGGQIDVTYDELYPCTAASLPQPANNTRSCFPSWWKPENRPGEFGWFRKFNVTKVVEVDRTGLSPSRTTSYTYSGSPAWAFDHKAGMVPPEQLTWEQWRGYQKVLVTQGASKTEHLYFRGLHGQELVTVRNSRGGSELDYEFLEGHVFESRSLDANNVELAGTVNFFHVDKTFDGGTVDAWIVIPADANSRIRLSTGAYRYTRARTVYEDGTALPLKTVDYGEVEADGTNKATNDETCTDTTYARNASAYRFFPAVVESRGGLGCLDTDPLLSRTETFYDGHDALTDVPTNGRVTKSRAYRNDTAYAETKATYDIYGRVKTATDPMGRTTTTAYTPADNSPTTKVVTTNSKGWTAEKTFAPWWGLATSVKDENDRVTTIAYDPFGRPTKVWLPGRAVTGAASQLFSYGVTPYTPNWVKTRTLHSVAADGVSDPAHLDSWTYLDGFGNEVETQTAAPGTSGRMVVSKDYDTRGLLYWTSTPYYNTADPGSGAVNPAPGNLSRTATLYDALKRPTFTGFYTPTESPKWSTTTTYGGDRTTVTPPVGGTKTTIVDAVGRTTALIEETDSGTTTTSYGYSRRGELTSITDAKGNVTRYTYNLAGERIKAEDPDAGTTTYSHNVMGQIVTTTDARKKTVFTAYDDLGRKAALHDGSANGSKLAEWVYDTLPGGKGLLTSSTSYHGGHAYTRAVTGYDAAGRATGSSVTIPTVEGEAALAKTYTFGVTYDVAGRVATTSYPAAGGLGAETVTSTYNHWGLPSTLTGMINQVAQPYVSNTSYTPLAQLMRRFYGAGGTGDVRRFYTYEETTGRLSSAQAYHFTAVQDQRKILQWNSFVYDDIGNTVRADERSGTVIDPQVPARDASECFKYDKLNRLTQAWTTLDTTCAADPAAGTAKGVEPYHRAWTYDTIGNRLTETNKLTATPSTRTYTYPASGPDAVRPHAATQVETGATTPDSFSYDAAGNTTERTIDGLTSTFAWDHFGRLDHADTQRTSGGSTVTERTSYVYDADGERLIRREPGNTVLYLGGMELRLTTEGPGTGTVSGTRYYAHGGAPVAVRTVDGLHWVLNNPQASAEVAVDATTGAATRRRYLPFGGDRSVAATITAWPSERGFLNKTKDSTTGLTHLGAREYDTSNGRFLTPDPLVQMGHPQSTAYNYAANNPISFKDPSGLAPTCAKQCKDENDMPGPLPGNPPKPPSPSPSIPVGSPSSPSGGPPGTHRSGREIASEELRDELARVRRYLANTENQHGDTRLLYRHVITEWCGRWSAVVTCSSFDGPQEDIHLALDLAGMVPVIGEPADAANAVIYAVEGDWANAGLSAVGLIPFAGGAAIAAKLARRASKACNSFDPDTPVLMADGSTKKIKDIRIGDKVLAADETTGKAGGAEEVTHLYATAHDGDLVDLTIQDSTGRQHIVETTAEHPFWNEHEKTWTPAGLLSPGDQLRDASNRSMRLQAVTPRAGAATMLNLTIERLHTYYVLAGDTPVLVHNTGVGACPVNGLPHGKLGEAATRQRLQDAGYVNITPEVTFHTAGGTEFRADFVARGANGGWVAVEAKTGRGAVFTPNQAVGYPELNSVGAIVGTSKLDGFGMPKGSAVSMRVEVDIWSCPVCGY